MLCEKCNKNQATTHIKTVVNGILTEHNLCSRCAAEEGYTGFPSNSLAGLISSMFGDSMPMKVSSVRCPVCGATFSDISKTGKVGCSECYKTFYNELLPYLKRIHGSTKHVGKIPISSPITEESSMETIESLRVELNRLVSEEKYEEAAVVRDKIKELEEKKDE